MSGRMRPCACRPEHVRYSSIAPGVDKKRFGKLRESTGSMIEDFRDDGLHRLQICIEPIERRGGALFGRRGEDRITVFRGGIEHGEGHNGSASPLLERYGVERD